MADVTKAARHLPGRRREKGWSQDDLAQRLSVRQTTVSNWERFAGRPEPHQREALSLLLGLPVEDWYTSDERALLRRVEKSAEAELATGTEG